MTTTTPRAQSLSLLVGAITPSILLLAGCAEPSQPAAVPSDTVKLADETVPRVTPPRETEALGWHHPETAPSLSVDSGAHVGLVRSSGANLLLGDDSSIALVLAQDLDADGFYEAADDEEPASTGSIEIDVTVNATLTAGTWSYELEVLLEDNPVSSIPPAPLANGPNVARVSLPAADGQVYVVRATATEAAEGATLIDNVAAVVDATLPTLSFSMPAAADEADDLSSSAGLQLALSITHDGLAPGSTLSAQSDLDGSIGSAVVGGSSPTALVISLVSAGAHTVTVTASDTAGNQASAQDATTLSLTPPSITILSPANGSALSSQHDTHPAAGLQLTMSVVVTGCEEGQIVVTDGATTLGTATAAPSGDDTIGIAISSSLEGARSWAASCDDGIATATTSISASVDITGPAAPSSLTPASADVRRGDVSLSFYAPLDASAMTVQLAWSRSPIDAASFGAPGQNTRTVPAVGAGEALDEMLEGLPFDTDFHVAVRAIDAAGNVGTVATTTVNAATSQLVLSSEEPGWGQALSRSMGDVDGDGYQDLVVGIPNMYTYGPGGFEIIYGAATPGGVRRTGRIAPPATLPCSLEQCDTVEAGWTVNVLPDLNGDGLQEVAVIAYDQRYTSDFVLIYPGTSGTMSTSAQPASVLEYAVDDYGGAWVVDGVGDVNGDGAQDWVIALGWGAETYLFLGGLPASGLMDERASTVIYTSAVDEYPGMAAVGLSRPGVAADTLVISAYWPAGAWKIDGMASWPASIDLATYVPAHPGSFLSLSGAGSLTGIELTKGDVDGDGDDDAIALGDAGAAVIENAAGALVLRGALAAGNTIINGSSGVSGVDLNLDGKDDIVTSAGVVSFGGSLASPAVDVSYGLPVTSAAYAQHAAGDLIGGDAADVISLVADSSPTLIVRY